MKSSGATGKGGAEGAAVSFHQLKGFAHKLKCFDGKVCRGCLTISYLTLINRN